MRQLNFGAGGAQGAGNKFQGFLYFGLIGFRREKFRRIDKGSEDCRNVALALAECFGCSVDKRRRRIVGDESPGQFQGNKTSRRRMVGQEIDDAQAVFHSSSRRDAIAENDLLAVVVDPRFEIEAAFAAGLANRPAGQATRHLLDVPLSITAVNAKRVQFHKLAGVVFIQSPSAVVGASHPRGRQRWDWHSANCRDKRASPDFAP